VGGGEEGGGGGYDYLLSDEALGAAAELDVIGEVERLAPVDGLLVRLSAILGTEGGPADQAFKHDGAHAPPVAAERVALPAEDLRSDVVRSADGGVGHHAAGFAPHVDLRAVADGEVDLVETYGVAVAGLAGWFHELVIVGVFVLRMETCAQAEIGELDVATAIEKNVVGLDVTMVARNLMSALDPEVQRLVSLRKSIARGLLRQ